MRGRKIKAKAYRDWEREAGTELMCQRPERHEGPVSVSMTFGMPDKRRRDLDNLAKPVNDLLVKHQVIQRDDWFFVPEIHLKAEGGFSGVKVSITTLEAEGRE